MKKTLISLMIGTLAAANAYSSPLDLNQSLLANANYTANGKIKIREATKSINYGEIPLKEAKVISRVIDDEIQKSSNRDLSFIIKDSDTDVKIYDYGANSLSERDFFELDHRFSNGGSIKILARCNPNEQYEFNCRLDYSDGTNASTKIDTSKLNPLLRFIIRLKTKATIKKGERAYEEIVTSIDQGKKINIPYDEIKGILNELEKNLPDIRKKNNEDQAFGAFVNLCESYNKVIKEKNKSKP